MDEDDVYGVALLDTLPAVIQPAFAVNAATGESIFALRLVCQDGREWPWGGTDELVIALGRPAMATFLGEVTEVAERVFRAVHDAC